MGILKSDVGQPTMNLPPDTDVVMRDSAAALTLIADLAPSVMFGLDDGLYRRWFGNAEPLSFSQ